MASFIKTMKEVNPRLVEKLGPLFATAFSGMILKYLDIFQQKGPSEAEEELITIATQNKLELAPKLSKNQQKKINRAIEAEENIGSKQKLKVGKKADKMLIDRQLIFRKLLGGIKDPKLVDELKKINKKSLNNARNELELFKLQVAADSDFEPLAGEFKFNLHDLQDIWRFIGIEVPPEFNFNYCGPGTTIKSNLQNGVAPTSAADFACMYHDLDYLNSLDMNDVRDADKRLIDRQKKIMDDPDMPEYVKSQARFVHTLMTAKVKAEDIGILPQDAFIKPVEMTKKRQKEYEKRIKRILEQPLIEPFEQTGIIKNIEEFKRDIKNMNLESIKNKYVGNIITMDEDKKMEQVLNDIQRIIGSSRDIDSIEGRIRDIYNLIMSSDNAEAKEAIKIYFNDIIRAVDIDVITDITDEDDDKDVISKISDAIRAYRVGALNKTQGVSQEEIKTIKNFKLNKRRITQMKNKIGSINIKDIAQNIVLEIDDDEDEQELLDEPVEEVKEDEKMAKLLEALQKSYDKKRLGKTTMLQGDSIFTTLENLGFSSEAETMRDLKNKLKSKGIPSTRELQTIANIINIYPRFLPKKDITEIYRKVGTMAKLIKNNLRDVLTFDQSESLKVKSGGGSTFESNKKNINKLIKAAETIRNIIEEDPNRIASLASKKGFDTNLFRMVSDAPAGTFVSEVEKKDEDEGGVLIDPEKDKSFIEEELEEEEDQEELEKDDAQKEAILLRNRENEMDAVFADGLQELSTNDEGFRQGRPFIAGEGDPNLIKETEQEQLEDINYIAQFNWFNPEDEFETGKKSAFYQSSVFRNKLRFNGKMFFPAVPHKPKKITNSLRQKLSVRFTPDVQARQKMINIAGQFDGQKPTKPMFFRNSIRDRFTTKRKVVNRGNMLYYPSNIDGRIH